MVVISGLIFLAATYYYVEQGTSRIARTVSLRAAITASDLSYYMQYKFPSDGAQLALAIGNGQQTVEKTVTPFAPATARSVPVLLYHGENESATSTMSTATFLDQMHALKADGWQTITMEQFRKYMKGEASLPDKSFMLTFDDARSIALYSIDPILKDLGYHAVMFVITGFSMPNNGENPTNNFYLSKAELAYMNESGRWDLESHGQEDHRAYEVPTATSTAKSLSMIGGQHFMGNRFWLPDQGRIETNQEFALRVAKDLTQARDTLRSDFNIPVIGYAYPFNDFGQQSINTPNAANIVASIVPSLYTFSFYQTWAGNGDSFNYPSATAYSIKRIEPPTNWSGDELIASLDGGRVKSLPYISSGFGADWQSNWGVLDRTAQGLSISAATSTTGASAILNGSETWTNYKVDASFDWNAGTVSLIARHTEANQPYVTCAFSQDRIYLERHTQDSHVALARSDYKPPKLPTTAHVSMSVLGSVASCTAYGVTVSASVPDIDSNGGIGVSVWDTPLHTAAATLRTLSVRPL